MDVRGRMRRGIVGEGAEGLVHVGAIAHHRIEQRAAALAEGVVIIRRAVDREALSALGDGELVALDTAERLEGRAGGAPALRAVAVHGVAEFVAHLVLHRAAQAAAGQNTVLLRQVASTNHWRGDSRTMLASAEAFTSAAPSWSASRLAARR